MKYFTMLLTAALALSISAPSSAQSKPAQSKQLKVRTQRTIEPRTPHKPNVVEEWLFKLAMRAAPPKWAWHPPTGPHSHETEVEREARYRDIAHDIYWVAFHEKSKTIPGFNRLRTAGFMLGMAIGESSLSPDADFGPCYHKGAYWSRCDGGRAVGLLQVWIHKSRQAPFWKDRKKLLWRGLVDLRGSFGSCRHLPIEERLAVVGAGTCSSEVGRRVSRKRWKLIQRVTSSAVAPKKVSHLIIKVKPKNELAKKKLAKNEPQKVSLLTK